MPISTTQIRQSYLGDGSSTQFAIPFPFYLDTDITVLLGTAEQSSGYSITGGEDASGNPQTGTVLFSSPPASGVPVQVILDVPLTQLVQLVDGTGFPSATLNQVNDRAIQAALRLSDLVGRTIVAPDGDVSPNLALPSASVRANTYPVFDSNGNLSVAQSVPSGTLSQATIGGFLQPTTAAETAAGVTPTNYAYAPGPYIDVRRYGADPTGSADSTLAIQNAINVAQANPNGATVIMSPGVFKVTSQLLISSNRIRLIGSGMYATQVLFSPTADGICIKIAKGSTEINQCSLSDFAIYSNDSTYTKTGIDITDQSGCDYERIVIGGGVVVGGAGFWSGGSGSIGIRTRGRDTSTFRDITAFCDKPLVISINPHSSISIDHHNFHNCFLGGNGNPIVTIESGVTLTQVSFTGYQAWVLGTGGLYWVDATSPGSSNGLTIENLRYEGSTDVTRYVAQINVTSPLQMFVMRGGQAGACRGFHLRNVQQANFDSFFYTDNAKEAFNADGSCGQIYFKGCIWQTGSTASTSGLTLVKADPTASSQPIPSEGLLLPSGSFYLETRDETSSGAITPLAASATVQVGLGSQLGWLVVTNDTDQVVGTFFLKGTNHATALGPVSDAGFFSATAGNPSTINCYWDGGSHYVVQNGYGVSKTVRISGKVGKT